MSLSEQLTERVRACFSGIWIQSHEHQDALQEIAKLCREENWQMASWDIDRGLMATGNTHVAAKETGGEEPLAAVRALGAMDAGDGASLLVLMNFHRFLSSAEVVQAMAHQIQQGKTRRTFLIVLSAVIDIPVELQKHFVCIEHQRPDRQQLEAIASSIATDEGEFPTGVERDRVLDAAAGMTRCEAENAFSLSLVRHAQIEASAVWELKSEMLKTSGLLSLHRGNDRFDDLGGLTALKSFCLRAMRRQGEGQPQMRPRGVLLLSPPGCGKSQFCKSLGNETHRPTLVLDVGTLMGSLVGETEQRTREALAIADAMAPCVLMVDEIEKALGGVSHGGQSDSGVSSRLFGSLLIWLVRRRTA
ncbi:MAG: AAA family ATPase [Pirellulales bacterium]|nr:AAA family ATPase [Pirellulales bacterium]